MDKSRHQKLEQLNQEIISCRLCPRLVAWREQVAANKKRAYLDWDYWGKPVIGFGDLDAQLVIVGLAPGAHGSNRTGRMFTGDGSGNFLYPALYRAGFANQPTALTRDDNLKLTNLFITALARCAPPDNKPTPAEFLNCRPYLLREIDLLKNVQGYVALGGLAFNHLKDIYRQKGYQPDKTAFGHDVLASLGEGAPWMLASYHPSRQNTQTGRLTVEMFDQIWQRAKSLLV